VIFRAAVQVTGVRSEVVPGDSMDPTHAATAIVASPACDLAVVAASIVAALIVVAEAFGVVALVVVVEVSEVVEAAGAAAAGAGRPYESYYEITGARI
jgi:hypothetical protein